MRTLELPHTSGMASMSFAEIVLQKALTFGARLSLINAATSEAWTYKDLVDQSYNMANGLYGQGLRKGDTVVICLSNCTEYLVAFFGTILCGGIVAGIIDEQEIRSITNQMELAEPKFIFTSEHDLDKVKATSTNCGMLKKIIIVGNTLEETTNYRELLLPHTKFQRVSISPSDVAVITFTSGSTGLSKAVLVTHGNLNIVVSGYSSPDWAMYTEGQDVTVMCRPLTHGYGLVVHCVGVYQGATQVFPRERLGMFGDNMMDLLALIEQYKVTLLPLTPARLVNMMNLSNLNDYDTSSLTSVITAGAPLIESVAEKFIDTFKIKSLRNLYGMSECLTIAHPHPGRHSVGFGRLFPHGRGKILEISTAKELGPTGVGELWLKGPAVCPGYKNNEAANRESFVDGWFKTGDVAYFDEDDYLHIVDRLKDIIKYDAHIIPPGRIEAVILEHPGVAEVAVVGKPDAVYGELATAFVVPKPGVQLTETQIISRVKANMSVDTLQLHGGARVVESLPKLPSGKISKLQLKSKLQSTIYE